MQCRQLQLVRMQLTPSVPPDPGPRERGFQPSRPLKRITTLALGWGLVVLGVIGLFLPVLQGIAFIVLGLYVLSRESRRARSLLDRLRKRHPSLDMTLQRMKRRFTERRSRENAPERDARER